MFHQTGKAEHRLKEFVGFADTSDDLFLSSYG